MAVAVRSTAPMAGDMSNFHSLDQVTPSTSTRPENFSPADIGLAEMRMSPNIPRSEDPASWLGAASAISTTIASTRAVRFDPDAMLTNMPNEVSVIAIRRPLQWHS